VVKQVKKEKPTEEQRISTTSVEGIQHGKGIWKKYEYKKSSCEGSTTDEDE
jgi:hypothetical protein